MAPGSLDQLARFADQVEALFAAGRDADAERLLGRLLEAVAVEVRERDPRPVALFEDLLLRAQQARAPLPVERAESE